MGPISAAQLALNVRCNWHWLCASRRWCRVAAKIIVRIAHTSYSALEHISCAAVIVDRGSRIDRYQFAFAHNRTPHAAHHLVTTESVHLFVSRTARNAVSIPLIGHFATLKIPHCIASKGPITSKYSTRTIWKLPSYWIVFCWSRAHSRSRSRGTMKETNRCNRVWSACHRQCLALCSKKGITNR